MTSRERVVGLQHPVAELVKTHLFVLCPNNSGSTFVKNALALSPSVWGLSVEGQRTFGFCGPRHAPLTWAAEPDDVAAYRQSDAFDWSASSQAWYAQATALDPSAAVFVEKSPPFLLIPDQLSAAFSGALFLLMVRNPFAMYEGIVRRAARWHKEPWYRGTTSPQVVAARHVAACFKAQRANATSLDGNAMFTTYEELCAQPRQVADRLCQFVPHLYDVNFDQQVSVKGVYDEGLRNMNHDQIDRLSQNDLDIAIDTFAPAKDDLAFFGYGLTPNIGAG